MDTFLTVIGVIIAATFLISLIAVIAFFFLFKDFTRGFMKGFNDARRDIERTEREMDEFNEELKKDVAAFKERRKNVK